MQPPATLIKGGIRSLPCIGDARQSGTSGSPSILNVSPEGAAGGRLARLRAGDRIRFNLKARTAGKTARAAIPRYFVRCAVFLKIDTEGRSRAGCRPRLRVGNLWASGAYRGTSALTASLIPRFQLPQLKLRYAQAGLEDWSRVTTQVEPRRPICPVSKSCSRS
jgi:hypothetical protein